METKDEIIQKIKELIEKAPPLWVDVLVEQMGKKNLLFMQMPTEREA